ncbi:MAG: SRPBCC family protein [Caulobacterales bacterium]
MAPLPIKIEHRIGVQTPPEVIWEIVSDIPGWSAWNPLYPKAEGAVRIDTVLTLELALPGQAPRIIRPKIVDWTPNEQILWRLNLLGGLIRSVRYIEIEKLTETGCIFSNGEMFEGPLMRLINRKLQRTIKAGFTAMGEAVHARAEAAWQAQGGGAT